MYKDDKICKVTEVLEEKFVEDARHPFLLFVEPKGNASVATISARPIYNDEMANLPFVPNVWNPVVLNKVEVTSAVLAEFKVFVGYEASSL